MKTTLTVVAVTALFISTKANAQVNTIDSIATAKVQHFNFDERELNANGFMVKKDK